MFKYPSVLDVLMVVPFKWPLWPHYSLCAEGMLLNVTEFPIGICFGDRDYLGSEGADEVVRTNAFFKTGEA